MVSLSFMIAVVKTESYFSCHVKCVEITLPFKIVASINKLVIKPALALHIKT